MIKIVPDANLLLSGMLSHSQSRTRQILNLALAKKVVMYGSKETYDEFCEKVMMPKFSKYWKKQIFTPEKIILDYKAIVNIMDTKGILENVNVVKKDPDDDCYFKIAKSCGAKIIITGDKAVLEVKKFEDIRVVEPSKFLDSFSKISSGNLF